MAVLCEAISVLVPVEVLMRSFPGGPASYEQLVPNASFCSDGVLTRVGFMHHNDSRAWCDLLEDAGLEYFRSDEDGSLSAVDFIVVDQRQGPLVNCHWLSTEITEGDLWGWLTDYGRGENCVPDGWAAGRSSSLIFTAAEDQEGSLIRSAESGSGLESIDELLDPETGAVRFVGRAFPHLQKRDQAIRSAQDLYELGDFRGAYQAIQAAEAQAELDGSGKSLAANITYDLCFSNPQDPAIRALAPEAVRRWTELTSVTSLDQSDNAWFKRARAEGLCQEWRASATSLETALTINPEDAYALAERAFVAAHLREGGDVIREFMSRAAAVAVDEDSLNYVEAVMDALTRRRK